ncbi:MAG: VOC family protein [Kordiimonadaceae bacterium]|jgi:predicted lactoylglutathione lyase|nr:VOC family protein [Kordiimonadaceae bacterium]MBT6330890.1 VOC family protein [Kordiimonadaceae bacterium]MBT7582539.1 VOC family protein [Kordiimonadaceae bacterium]
MIGYTMVGTKEIKKAGAFFDNVLGVLGAKRSMDHDNFIVWSVTPDQPSFSVCLPHNGEAASVGNGVMTAFNAMSPKQVKEVYDCALENGGTTEGEPGERSDGFYAAYFRDADGNKFAVFNFGGEIG